MKKKKNILDLSKSRSKTKKTFFGLKTKNKLSSKPNLGFGVNVRSIKTRKKSLSSIRKVNNKSPLKLKDKKKIKSIRVRDYNTANYSEEIDDIWGRNRNNSQNTFNKRPTSRKKILPVIIVLLFLLAGASLAGWYFFGTKKLNGAGVVLTIKAPEKIVSGEQVELLIKYQNKENVKVKNLELRIAYPKGFHYISAEPQATTLSSNVWQLKDLKAGESGQIRLIAQIIGQLDEEISLEPVLSYEPSNFSSFFESKALKVFKIDSLLMDFQVKAPAEIGNNNRVTYQLSYKNLSELPLDNFRIRLEYPDNFNIIETGGDAKLLTADTWDIGRIMKNEENNITITGFFDLENISSSTVTAILEIKSPVAEIPLIGESNSNWYPYLTIKKKIVLSDLAANLRIYINKDNKDSAIDWGSKLEYVINYKNISDFSLNNVEINVLLDSDYLDWGSLEDNFNGQVDEGQKSIVWNKKNIPSLAKLDIGQEGQISFKIKVFDFDKKYLEDNNQNYLIKSEAFLDATELNQSTLPDSDINDSHLEQALNSNVIINKINTPLEFSAKARYYDDAGQMLGSGPLPPVVGETTSYQIVWKLKSLTADLKNVLVKTTLPPGVEWGQGVSADDQDLIFNDATKQVVWKIDNLEKSKDNLLKFNVLITPDKNQIDKLVTLSNTINLTAEDVYSQGKIDLHADYLTTELIGDKKAEAKGRVIDLNSQL